MVVITNNFVAVKMSCTILYPVYLPTHYNDEKSDRKFSMACSKLAKSISGILSSGWSVIPDEDLNCNFNNESSPRAQIVLSSCKSFLSGVCRKWYRLYIHSQLRVNLLSDFFLISMQTTPQAIINLMFHIDISDFPWLCIHSNFTVMFVPPVEKKKSGFICLSGIKRMLACSSRPVMIYLTRWKCHFCYCKKPRHYLRQRIKFRWICIQVSWFTQCNVQKKGLFQSERSGLDRESLVGPKTLS